MLVCWKHCRKRKKEWVQRTREAMAEEFWAWDPDELVSD